MSTNSSNFDNIPVGAQGTNSGVAQTNAQEGTQPVPTTASEVPLTGLEGGKDVPFGEQVKGHAKMFAGKVFGNDKEAQQGAERIAGLDNPNQPSNQN
ncbi:uncharacterized protein FA14DRAFT_159248 [Meira miltonrushii]|uniref:Uncharacterized protein n=1 Tax=Meira miltonrushii TaxID=1280837 RepID=A0A316VHE0_9BASI|nr:uncharacterized protein FA14DRAFT_159248 [Meira miltonrushii]PWN37012.1 hypothetical protein FA14DRAFT_159248 [Meira miltonrushii]